MIIEASATGLVRTLLIIGGVFLLLRFLGQLMVAKRNMEDEREFNAKHREFEAEKKAKKQGEGKMNVLGKKRYTDKNIQDVDFEEVD